MGAVSIDVCTSGIWQTSSTVISVGGGCIVVDPAYFPRELDEIAARAAAQGGAAAVVFTHGHWDHVMGWQHFPGAEVWASPSLAAAVAAADDTAAANLASARDFDARWYVERDHPVRWPDSVRALVDGERIRHTGIEIDAVQLPGHSDDGLGLVVDGRWLLPGDYLSPCEIPFIHDVWEYRTTLHRLLGILAGVDEVVPGHGRRMPSADAVTIAHEDLVYVEALIGAAEREDASAALAVELPRAGDVPGMRDHHRANCRAAGVPPPD